MAVSFEVGEAVNWIGTVGRGKRIKIKYREGVVEKLDGDLALVREGRRTVVLPISALWKGGLSQFRLTEEQ